MSALRLGTFALVLALSACAGADAGAPASDDTAEQIPPAPPAPPAPPPLPESPLSSTSAAGAKSPPPFVDYEADCALPLSEADDENAVFYLDGERLGRGNVRNQIDPESVTDLTVYKCVDLVPEPSLLGIVVVSTTR